MDIVAGSHFMENLEQKTSNWDLIQQVMKKLVIFNIISKEEGLICINSS